MNDEIEQLAFLLHSRPYRENQQIVSLLTASNGMVGAITYISNSSKSAKKALLQPFMPLNVVLKGSGSLKNLARVEAAGKSFNLQSKHLYSGFYLNELLVRLLEESIACDDLFIHYQASLKALAQQSNIEHILRFFETSLLEELGISLDFSALSECNAQYFNYIPEEGFIEAENTSKLPRYHREHIEAIAQQSLDAKTVMYSYKQLMRQVFDHLLSYKPLNSRKLFLKRESHQ